MDNSEKFKKQRTFNNYTSNTINNKNMDEISLEFNLTENNINNNINKSDQQITQSKLKRNNFRNKNFEKNAKFKINETPKSHLDEGNNYLNELEEGNRNENKGRERNFKKEIKELNFSQVTVRDKSNNMKLNKNLEDLYPFEYETAKSKKSKKSKKSSEKNIKENPINKSNNNNNNSSSKNMNLEEAVKGIEMENLILKRLMDNKEKNEKNNIENVLYESQKKEIDGNANRVNTVGSKKQMNSELSKEDLNSRNLHTHGNLDQNGKESLKNLNKFFKPEEKEEVSEKPNYGKNDKLNANGVFNDPSNVQNKKTKERRNLKSLNHEKSGIFAHNSNLNNHNNALETQVLINNNNHKFKENERLENVKLTKEEVFVGKIDKVFELIEKSDIEKNPFSMQMIFLLLINFVNMMNFCSYNYIISDVKNNYYCWDRHSATISVCDQDEFCDMLKAGAHNIAYISDPNISDESEIIESINLNKYFRSVFLVDAMRYSFWNPAVENKTAIGMDSFSAVLAMNSNENWNLYVYYNLVCTRSKILITMCIIMIFALIVFAVLFSYIADVYGRKPLLCILLLLQITGMLITGLFDLPMVQRLDGLQKEFDLYFSNSTYVRNVDIHSFNNFQFDQNFFNLKKPNDTASNQNINFTKLLSQNNFLTEKYNIENIYYTNSSLQMNYYTLNLNAISNSDESDSHKRFNFMIYNFDKDYQRSFLYFHFQKLKTKIKRNFYLNNQSLFLLGFFLSCGTTPAIFNLTLALIMETSLNLSIGLENYKTFNLSYIFSFIVPYFLLTFFDSFKMVFMIFAILQIILLIIFLVFGMESPRYLYEISAWERIKQLLNKLLLKGYLEKSQILDCIKNENDPYLQNEIKQESKCESLSRLLKKSVMFSLNLKKFENFYKKYKAGKIEKIKFHKMLKFPLLNFSLIFKSKSYKYYNLVVLSLVFNLSITLFLIQNKFSSDLIISRQALFSKSSAVWFHVFNFFIMFAANFLFMWLERIWGYPIVMSLCYFFIFIFSLVLATGNIKNYVNYDLNKQVTGKLNYYENPNHDNNVVLVAFCSFFVHGLYFPFFLYITKFTRTIYRSTFYGFIQLNIFGIWMISVPLTQYFANNYFFLCVSSLVGFFISYFTVNNQDEILVQDFRKLVIEDK